MATEPEVSELRKKAESLIAGNADEGEELRKEEVQKIIHELRVHQIELELQNDELRSIQKTLEELKNKYSRLYDFAPIGYATIDREFLLREINLSGAVMLKEDRRRLINQRVTAFIHPDHQDRFYFHMKEEVFEEKRKISCDLVMRRSTG